MLHRFLFILCGWLISGSLLSAQTFVPAQWMTADGKFQLGEVRLPTHAFSKENRVYYRLNAEEELLDPAALEWLVVGADTLLYRLRDGLRRPLLQLMTGGEVAIYREINAKSINHYHFYHRGGWIAANNSTLRQDIDSLWTAGCVSARNTGHRYQWQDAALIGEDVQTCLGEDPTQVYRVLGSTEYRQWSVGTNLGGPLASLAGAEASLYSLQAGISQQYRRVNRGFYVDAQLMLFHFRDRRPLEATNAFLGPSLDFSVYNQDWRLTGMLINAGLRLDVAPTRKMGPYFGIGYGLLLPLDDRQEITVMEGETGIPGWPTRLTVENAVIIGHGSYTDIGWRYTVDDNWSLRLHFRLDPRTINTDYTGSSAEAIRLLNSQEAFSSISFGSRFEFWVQKQFGQAKEE